MYQAWRLKIIHAFVKINCNIAPSYRAVFPVNLKIAYHASAKTNVKPVKMDMI